MRLLGKISFLLFVFLIFLDFASSLEIGARPSGLDFELRENEVVCKQIDLFSSSFINQVFVRDYWSETESRNLLDYDKHPSDFDIKIDYDGLIEIDAEEEFDFCVSAKESGEYFGVILFEIMDSNAAIGVWVNLDVNGREDTLTGLTGFASFSEYSANSLFLQMVFTFILSIILIYMIVNLRRRRFYLVS